MEEQENKYTLLVNKKRIAVGKEVYKAYYQQKEREAYLDKLTNKHNISFEECEGKGIRIDYILSQTQESIEDKLIREEMLSRLTVALEMLTEQEKLLVHALFFMGKSERELCAALKTLFMEKIISVGVKVENIRILPAAEFFDKV